MADAWPMIETGMRLQSEWQTFLACPDCLHEADQEENTLIFYCDWCYGRERVIQPIRLKPMLIDGTIKLVKQEEVIFFGMDVG